MNCLNPHPFFPPRVRREDVSPSRQARSPKRICRCVLFLRPPPKPRPRIPVAYVRAWCNYPPNPLLSPFWTKSPTIPLDCRYFPTGYRFSPKCLPLHVLFNFLFLLRRLGPGPALGIPPPEAFFFPPSFLVSFLSNEPTHGQFSTPLEALYHSTCLPPCLPRPSPLSAFPTFRRTNQQPPLVRLPPFLLRY